jgi:hypothetical protein
MRTYRFLRRYEKLTRVRPWACIRHADHVRLVVAQAGVEFVAEVLAPDGVAARPM